MMKKIALLQFDNDPWTKILKIALEETLKNNYEITFLKDAYPKKNDKFTFIFMLGIRPIIKKNLDGLRIKKQTRFLIEFGDYSHDQRTSVEDCYFYFLEGDSKYANHYRKLPKFIFDHLLFQEQNDEKLTIFVDHFLGRDSYNDLVYDQISSCPFPLRVFYQHHSGIIENPDKKTFLSTIDPYNKKFKFIPFDEIAKIYRQTHAFFPTHSETQGMVALEIGACGGLTFMKPNTYPGDVPTKFYHVYYDEDHPIDWKYFLEETGPEKRIKYRDQVLKEYTFNLFKNELLENLKDIEANGPNKLS
jgi:hypothetical protein